MYSNSVMERATEPCFFDDQDTASSVNVETNPDTDSHSSSPPQFASLQTFNLMPRFPLYMIPSSIVSLRYRSLYFAAFSCALVDFCHTPISIIFANLLCLSGPSAFVKPSATISSVEQYSSRVVSSSTQFLTK